MRMVDTVEGQLELGGGDWAAAAAAINAAWSKGIDSIFETGRMLVDARDGPNKLAHGTFQSMVNLKLSFIPQHRPE
jgi:hypothetical protein